MNAAIAVTSADVQDTVHARKATQLPQKIVFMQDQSVCVRFLTCLYPSPGQLLQTERIEEVALSDLQSNGDDARQKIAW